LFVNKPFFAELVELTEANPKIRFGRFTPGKGGEDETIEKNWNKLVQR
jgi:hypothetical protein